MNCIPLHETHRLRTRAHVDCRRATLAALALLVASVAQADTATDWNARAIDFVVAASLANQPAHRVLALAHTAAFDAARSLGRGPQSAPAEALDAAIGAAHCLTLARLLPTQQSAVEASCRQVLDAIPAGAARQAGLDAGERAARELLAARSDDGAVAPDTYRPFTSAGRYVPTTTPASPHWGLRRPWLMSSPSQFRPAPPPALDSERWARDYNEIKQLGGAKSTQRTAEQTETARFWETTHPSIYHAMVRGVAMQPGRHVLRNARLFAAFTQAIDDAMIAVFDAKYHYAFWRPITAIRNGDLDGNDATERDPGWTPLITTPVHPEYPCAHCVQAGVTGAVLAAETGRSAPPVFATVSPSAKGAQRRYASLDAFVQEVADARVWDGVHFRFSTEAGSEIGRRVGALAVQRVLHAD